jgi:hypothetical protein
MSTCRSTYDTANRLFASAAAWWAAVDAQWPELAKAEHMTGSYSEAKEWAISYDRRAIEVLTMVDTTASAVHNYACGLQTMGYNHALAEHAATLDAGPAPEKPSTPILPMQLVFRIPLPSAGGPGQGLIDDGIGLVEKIGIVIPDGDATKMSNTADTWDRIRTAGAVVALPADLEAAARAFDDVTAFESAFIDEDLRAAKAAAEAVITAMTELANSCREHHKNLDDLRTQLVEHLNEIRDALLTELAINAAISVASSFVTFGLGAAAGVAGAAAICARFARPIRVRIAEAKAMFAEFNARRDAVPPEEQIHLRDRFGDEDKLGTDHEEQYWKDVEERKKRGEYWG